MRFLAPLAPLLLLAGAAAAQGWTMIENEPDPQEGPLVVGGCVIEPRTACPGADLTHARLRGVDLTGADLRGAKLARADLTYAKLAGATLDGADLRGATLAKAHMQGASLRGADLTGADLGHARMAKADFSAALLVAANLDAVWASKAMFVGAVIYECDLQEAKFYDATFENAFLAGNAMKYAIWQSAYMGGCDGCPVGW